jgi:hypothetical protein
MYMKFMRRYFPGLAHCVAPVAPAHLRPTAQQLDLLEQHDIACVGVILYDAGGAVQRSIWRHGRQDHFLPIELARLPRDVLVLQRVAARTYKVRAGEHYAQLSTQEFTEVLDLLLANTLTSIRYFQGCAEAVGVDF